MGACAKLILPWVLSPCQRLGRPVLRVSQLLRLADLTCQPTLEFLAACSMHRQAWQLPWMYHVGGSMPTHAGWHGLVLVFWHLALICASELPCMAAWHHFKPDGDACVCSKPDEGPSVWAECERCLFLAALAPHPLQLNLLSSLWSRFIRSVHTQRHTPPFPAFDHVHYQ